MYLQNQIIAYCSDEEQSVLYAGHSQWKTPACPVTLPWTSQRQITQNIWCTNWNICIRKTWWNPTQNSMPTPLTSVRLCGCKPAQEAAQSICRECLSSKQIFAVINTQIYLQEAPRGCTRKRIPLLKLNHPGVFQTEIDTLRKVFCKKRPLPLQY